MSFTSIVGYFSNAGESGSVCFIDTAFNFVSAISAIPMTRDSSQTFSVEVPQDITTEQVWAINTVVDSFVFWQPATKRSMEMQFSESHGNIKTGFRTYNSSGVFTQILFDPQTSQWNITGEFGWDVEKQRPVIGNNVPTENQKVYALDNGRLCIEDTVLLVFSDDSGKTWTSRRLENVVQSLYAQRLAPVKIGNTWVLLGGAGTTAGTQVMYVSEDNGDKWSLLSFTDPTKPNNANWLRESVVASNGRYGLAWNPTTTTIYKFVVGEYLEQVYFPNRVKEIYFESSTNKWWILGEGGTRYWSEDSDTSKWYLDSNHDLPSILVENYDASVIVGTNSGGSLFVQDTYWELQNTQIPSTNITQEAVYFYGDFVVASRAQPSAAQLTITKFDGVNTETVFSTQNINSNPDKDKTVLYLTDRNKVLVRTLDVATTARHKIDVKELDENFNLVSSYLMPNVSTSANTIRSKNNFSCIVASTDMQGTVMYEYKGDTSRWELLASSANGNRNFFGMVSNSNAAYTTHLGKLLESGDNWGMAKTDELNRNTIRAISASEEYVAYTYSNSLLIYHTDTGRTEIVSPPSGSGALNEPAFKGNSIYVLAGNNQVLVFDIVEKTWNSIAVDTRFFTTTSFTYFQSDDVFIRTATGGVLEYSFDNCETWNSINRGTDLTNQANTTATINSITYKDGVYYAYNNAGMILKSTDVITWYVHDFGTSVTINKVKRIGQTIFGFVQDTAMLLRSTDAKNWEILMQVPNIGTTSSPRAPRDIAFNGTQYLITASGRGNNVQNKVVFVTEDFVNYSQYSLNQTGSTYPETFGACTWFNGYWYIFGGYGGMPETFPRSGIVRTQDFENWELVRDRVGAPTFNNVETDGNIMVVSGSTADTTLYSLDGENWQGIVVPTWVQVDVVKYLNGMFILLLRNSRLIRYSFDGITYVNGIDSPTAITFVDMDFDPVQQLFVGITRDANNTRVLSGDLLTPWQINTDDTSGIGSTCTYLDGTFHLSKSAPISFGSTVDGGEVEWGETSQLSGSLLGAVHNEDGWLIYATDAVFEKDNSNWNKKDLPGLLVAADRLVKSHDTYYFTMNFLVWETKDFLNYKTSIANIETRIDSISHRQDLIVALDKENQTLLYTEDRKTWNTTPVTNITRSPELSAAEVYLFDTNILLIDSKNSVWISDTVDGVWQEVKMLDGPIQEITTSDSTLIIKTKDTVYKTENMETWHEFKLNPSAANSSSMKSDGDSLVVVGDYTALICNAGVWQEKPLPIQGRKVSKVNNEWVIAGSNQSNFSITTTQDFESYQTNNYGAYKATSFCESNGLVFVNDFLARYRENEVTLLNKLSTVAAILPTLDNSSRYGYVYANNYSITKKEGREEKLIPITVPEQSTSATLQGSISPVVSDGVHAAFVLRAADGLKLMYSDDLETWNVNEHVTLSPMDIDVPMLEYADGKWVTSYKDGYITKLVVLEDIAGDFTEVELTTVSSARVPRSGAYLNGTWIFTTNSNVCYLLDRDLETVRQNSTIFSNASTVVAEDGDRFIAFSSGVFFTSYDGGDTWQQERIVSSADPVFLQTRGDNILAVIRAGSSVNIPEVLFSNDKGITWQTFNSTLTSSSGFGYLFDVVAYLDIPGVSYDRVISEIKVNGNFNDVVGMGFDSLDRETTLFLNGQEILKTLNFVGMDYPVVFAIAKSDDPGAQVKGRFTTSGYSYKYRYEEYPNTMCGDAVSAK